MSDCLPALPAFPAGPVATLAARRATGEARRKVIERTAQGVWAPAADRPEPVQTLLEANAGRVMDLLPIKW